MKNQLTENDDCNADINSFTADGRINIGSYVQVVDNATKKVVMQGVVTSEKVQATNEELEQAELPANQKLLSIDGSYFFWLDNYRYAVKKLPEIFIDKAFIRQHYELRSWRDCCKLGFNNADMFIERGINELDKEVMNIFETLISFSPQMKTTGSFSGHYKRPAWISIQFDNARTLEDFLSIFEPYKNKIRIVTSEILSIRTYIFQGNAYFPSKMILKLTTKEIGKPAYETLDAFDEYLNRIIKLRNETFNSLNEIIGQEKDANS